MAAPGSESYPARPWHEDPEWISELCRSIKFHELFRYTFAKPGHINVNEARVYKSWIKSVARGSCRTRVTALLDSRVTIGAAAKGRSSSFAISRILQGCLGYVLGSGIYQSLLHCYSQDNVADNPSRGKPVGAPTRLQSRWLQELMQGRPERFEKVVLSARIAKNPARWLRFLLLLAGDIERNPGPLARPVRGPLDMAAGFAPSTAHKMAKSSRLGCTSERAAGLNMCLHPLLPRPLRCGGTGSILVRAGTPKVPFCLRHHGSAGQIPRASAVFDAGLAGGQKVAASGAWLVQTSLASGSYTGCRELGAVMGLAPLGRTRDHWLFGHAPPCGARCFTAAGLGLPGGHFGPYAVFVCSFA